MHKFLLGALLVCCFHDALTAASETASGISSEDLVKALAEGGALDVVVPSDFEWDTYIAYHPEVYNKGITNELLAREYYSAIGWVTQPVYKRLQVFLRYTACTGLINQVYSHIAAISLGAMLGAEIVLPAAAVRDSFEHYFSVFKEKNEVLWSAAPLETLLDVDAIIDFWKEKGLIVHKAQALEPFPDLTQSQTAYIRFPHAGANPDWVATLGGVYSTYRDMDELVEMARKAIIDRAEEIQFDDESADVTHMVLDLPCTFFMLRTQSNIRLVGDVAKSLKWGRKVQSMADKVVDGIRKVDDSMFNSLHLRMEKDARDWMQILGGRDVVWHNYLESMKLAGFNESSQVYIASGLLTYETTAELEELIGDMKKARVCKSAIYKELYLSGYELDGLNSEQKALVDFLVLLQGRSFVGLGSSTFSYYLKEYRTLTGVRQAYSVLVDSSAIGTDQMFAEAATLS